MIEFSVDKKCSWFFITWWTFTSRTGGTVRFVYKHVMKGAFIEGASSTASAGLVTEYPKQRGVTMNFSPVS
jgi:hypothetical protein